MATIITRETGATAKGSPLSNAEVDNNFINLNAEVSPARPLTRPAFSLDFAGSKSVDSRIAFTRASGATHFNEQGLLVTKRNNQPRIDFDPLTGECRGLLIEEQRTNQFSAALETISKDTVGASQCTFAPQTAIAPDGSLRASTIRAHGTDAYTQTSTYVTAGNTYTASIWVKGKGSTIGKQVWIWAWFASTATGSNQFPASNTTLTDAWQRIQVQFTPTGTGYVIIRFEFGDTNFANPVVAGDEAYIYGMSVEQGSFLTSYIPSQINFLTRNSTATYFDSTGILRTAAPNQARYGYGYDSATAKWIPQGLIIEEAATNYIPNSVNLSSWSASYGGTITSNATTSPDGQTNGTKYTSGNGTIAYLNSQNTYSSGEVITYSIYFKQGNSTHAVAKVSRSSTTTYGEFGIALNFSTGTLSERIDGAGVILAKSVTSLGNGWYYCTVTGYIPNATGYAPYFYGSDSAFASQTSATVHAWGPQLEIGYAATSFIPTYGSPVTRVADSYSSSQTTRATEYGTIYSNLLDWYNNKSSSLSVIYSAPNRSGSTINRVVIMDSTQGSAGLSIYQNGNETRHEIYYSATGAGSLTGTTINATEYKAALAADSTGASVYVNGTQSTTTGTNVYPRYALNRLTIGALSNSFAQPLNGYIKKITYYPKRLSNSELQALTV